jgi:hypothetical protein
MRRLLALLAAAGMVAGALAARAAIDERRARSGLRLRLVCAAELADACERIRAAVAAKLAVTVEPAGATAARLSAVAGPEAAGLDGWLVPSPWPALVEADRRSAQRAPLFGAGPRRVLARSPVVILAWSDVAARLRGACGGAPGWRCAGDAAGRGELRLAHGDPTRDAAALVVLGQATVAYFGRPPGAIDRLDLTDDPGFDRWFTALERSVLAFDDDGAVRMLAQGRSYADAVGTVEAVAGPLLRRAARGPEAALIYPSPVATADLVLAPVGDTGAARRLAELLRSPAAGRALAVGGWRVPGQRPAAGVDPAVRLPATDGLPPAGLLAALQQRWREVAGR